MGDFKGKVIRLKALVCHFTHLTISAVGWVFCIIITIDFLTIIDIYLIFFFYGYDGRREMKKEDRND